MFPGEKTIHWSMPHDEHSPIFGLNFPIRRDAPGIVLESSVGSTRAIALPRNGIYRPCLPSLTPRS
jgi:hypothetical protein